MKSSLIILSFFVLGWITGQTALLPVDIDWNAPTKYALYLLMTLAGISIGAERGAWKLIVTIQHKIIWVPIGVFAGTLAGSAIVALLLPNLSVRESLAIGAGFGYYSLSSIFISELHSELLGVTALISNILREILTLLTAPLLVKYFGELAPIASGGATAMDTTLPVITRYSGKDYAIIALFSGIVLTIAVPFLVTLILTVWK